MIRYTGTSTEARNYFYEDYMNKIIRTIKHVHPTRKLWLWNVILEDTSTANPGTIPTLDEVKLLYRTTIQDARDFTRLGFVTEHPQITAKHVKCFNPSTWDYELIAQEYSKLYTQEFTLEEVKHMFKHTDYRIDDFATPYQIALSLANNLSEAMLLCTEEEKEALHALLK